MGTTKPASGSNVSFCIACREPVSGLRDFGSQPLTNRFPASPDEPVCEHPLRLGQCPACGLVQLATPAPPELLRPPKPMSYREPERHLDDAVGQLLALPALSASIRCCGLTYKDATTIDRLQRLGCRNSRVLDATRDLGVTEQTAGLETLQACITPQLTKGLAQRDGLYDCVIARHILEHAHDTAGFLTAISGLLSPQGYLMVEVPDSSDGMTTCDYTMLWEEHVAYFTPNSLEQTLIRCGYTVETMLVYPYAQENSLVAVARRRAAQDADVDSARLASQHLARPSDLARRYSERFDEVRLQWHATLAELRSTLGPIALFGAGHRTTTFIKLLGLEALMDYVIDEAADKIGAYVPGTRLRISPPSVLLDDSLRTCLLAVSSEFEDQLVTRYQQVRQRGGEFFSIFPDSDYAIEGHARAGE